MATSIPGNLTFAAVNEASPAAAIDAASADYAFGRFRLFVRKRELLEADRLVPLGGRAMDLLIGLVRRAGEVVTKQELMATAWPNIFVGETNLRVHLSALRKALGEGQGGQRFVVTVAGRGYVFVAPVSVGTGPHGSSGSAPGRLHNLPALLDRTVGRDAVVETLSARLGAHRFLTVTGAGGIGKTTAAIAVAHQVVAMFPDGIRFVDLAPITDERRVVSALAAVLRLPIAPDDPLPHLSRALAGRRSLIILDNCEHVIDAASRLAEALLKASPNVRVLATSREPLRAEGEWVYRLPPLEVPPAEVRGGASDALTYSAVQLFVERAAAATGSCEVADMDAVVDICRHLDGVPLAIELCSGMVEAFGIQGVVEHLQDRHLLLARGRRTALARHRTLGATLDWSFELLGEAERTVLRRLAVFAGYFSIEAASAVVVDEAVDAPAVVECIASLIAKSLVVAEGGGGSVIYRLLQTTRAYLLEKLAESGEQAEFERRHAAYFRDLFRQFDEDVETASKEHWLTRYRLGIDNVRAALDWSFAAGAARSTGIPLVIAAGPLWAMFLLYDEWLERATQGLSHLDPAAEADRRQRMQLLSALATARLHVDGSGPALDAAWSEVLALAGQLGDEDHALLASRGLMLSAQPRDCRLALSYAERFHAIADASGDARARAIGDRLVGYSWHMLGDQAAARPLVERMLSSHPGQSGSAELLSYGFDQRIIGQTVLSLILWLQGLPNQAVALARSATLEARALDHDASLFFALSRTMFPVAVLTGQLPMADAAVAMLRDRFSRFPPYDLWRRAFEGIALVRHGRLGAGLATLEAALDAAPGDALSARFSFLATELAAALARDSRPQEGLRVVRDALRRAREIEELWWEAELVRVRGEIELRQGATDTATASFDEARAIAGCQGALSLELRAATSLARLWRREGRMAEARELLGTTYGRFDEGFATADLVAAGQLLEELR